MEENTTDGPGENAPAEPNEIDELDLSLIVGDDLFAASCIYRTGLAAVEEGPAECRDFLGRASTNLEEALKARVGDDPVAMVRELLRVVEEENP